ncbi:MAG: PAS domain S-box protein [Acidobacteriota bacterium]
MTSEGRPLRVLLVEDTGSDALLVRRALERSSAAVDLMVVSRAEDALERLGDDVSAVDVLVSDHRLPGMSGLELCRAVLDRGLDVGTVLLTGVGSEDLAIQALKAGVDEYLIKDTGGGYLALMPTVLVEVDRRRREQNEHRRAQQRLRHLAAIVESSDDAILGCDLDQRIVSWNPAASRLFGWPAELAIGQSASILLPVDHGDEMPRILARVRAGERIDHYETVRRRRDGSILQVALAVSPIRGADGTVVGSSSIFRDLTAQRRAEASRRRSHHELEIFLQGVTHALKPSLQSARGVVDLVFSERRDDELAPYLDRLGASLDDMARVLDDVSALAEASRDDVARSQIAPASLAAEVVEAACEQGRCDVEIHVEPEMPPVLADAGRLHRVLRCLIDNALRYARQRVDLRAERDPNRLDQVLLTVADDGPGIPRGEQAWIFEPFYCRAPAVGATAGPGLGLTFARRVAQAMGGDLWVDSEVGRGATFVLALPAPMTA